MDPPASSPLPEKNSREKDARLLTSPQKDVDATIETLHRINYMKQAYGIGNLDEYSILNMDTLEAMVEEAQSKVSNKYSIIKLSTHARK